MLEKKVHGLWVAISFYSILSFLIFEFIVQGYSVVTSHVVNDVQWSYRPAILYYNPPTKIIHIKEWVIRKLQSGISGNSFTLKWYIADAICKFIVIYPSETSSFVSNHYTLCWEIRYCQAYLNDMSLPSNLSVFEPSGPWIASTPFQNPSTKSWCLTTTASLTPWPCNLVSISFHESSKLFEASKTPFALTPTCATCLKESGAGDEIIDREMELIDDFDDLFFWRCVLLGKSRITQRVSKSFSLSWSKVGTDQYRTAGSWPSFQIEQLHRRRWREIHSAESTFISA